MTASSLSAGTTRGAGRELDALVAETVMGWRPPTGRKRGEGSTWYAPEGYGASFGAWPAYSTDIAAAFLVVERMHALGFHTRLTTPFVPGDDCHAGFTPHGTTGWNGRPDFAAGAPTLALAICLAALSALTPSQETKP